MSLCLLPQSVSAETVPETEIAEQGQAAADEKLDPQNPEHRKRVYSVTVGMFVLVTILGVMFVALVILWGHRLRRASRTPGKKITPLDPLWYLKQNENSQTESRGNSPGQENIQRPDS